MTTHGPKCERTLFPIIYGTICRCFFPPMETETTAACCSNPGCDQPGTSKCGACKTTPYCGPICQTAHWVHHREECEGHLLKLGNAHLAKAASFYSDNNFAQALRYSDLALSKFNAMKKHPLEAIADALGCKCDVLKFLGRYPESLQCAKDMYNMWAMARGPAHPSTIDAAFYLIDGLLHNKEYEDGYHFAHTLWEIIHTNNHVDNDIPSDKRQEYVAKAAELLARTTNLLARSGGIPPEEKQEAGEMAIARARQALEIYTQLHGAESESVAVSMGGLANVLSSFGSSCYDDEVVRLFEQAIAIHGQVYGRMSLNVGIIERNLGHVYCDRAEKAHAAYDWGREQANLELALPHFREAARIYRAVGHVDKADSTARCVSSLEKRLHQLSITGAAAAAASPKICQFTPSKGRKK